MALLFVGGVMNVPWIVLLASLVLLEKVTSFGRLIAPVAGTVLIAAQGGGYCRWECIDGARAARAKTREAAP
jgi:predicted metal-binding membrane protein